MGGKRRTIITIESHRLTVAHSHSPFERWCKKCGKELPILTPEAATALAGDSPRAIYRRVEGGELYFVETGAGTLLIRAGSL